MKKGILFQSVILSVFFFLTCSVVCAGQAISSKDSQWARTAIQQEKNLTAPPEPNTIAVLNFANTTASTKYDPLQKGLALMLTTDLAKISSLQVLERVKMQALTEELDLGESGLVSAASTPRVGKLLAVQYLVGGEFYQEQTDHFVIQSDLVQLPSAQILNSPQAKGLLAEIFKLEKNILFQIIGALKQITITKEEEVELRKPFTDNIDALFNFFAGIDYSDRNNYSEARSFYQKALRKDPGFNLAKDALIELDKLGLIKDKRRHNLGNSLRNSTTLASPLASENLHDARNPAEADQIRSTGSIDVTW